MDIVNPNYLNYMEQIQKNRRDIEKLYDEELSDITQLNFKEDDENGLEYENGKAIFYGKSTIIRDENTQNLEVNSKVELKISSGDDDIVIDAGEDNSTLEIHLDNETRNKINRALLTPITTPSEREFVAVGTNNSQVMIPESEFTKKFNKKLNIYRDNNEDSDIIRISDSTLTTLQEFWELFNTDKTAIYKVTQNPNQITNFASVLPTPPISLYSTNYVFYFIKLYADGTSNNTYTMYEVISYIPYGSNNMCKGYITTTPTRQANFTGWIKCWS